MQIGNLHTSLQSLKEKVGDHRMSQTEHKRPPRVCFKMVQARMEWDFLQVAFGAWAPRYVATKSHSHTALPRLASDGCKVCGTSAQRMFRLDVCICKTLL